MELKRIWMVSAMILVSVNQWKSSNGCLDHEKTVLLKLRRIFQIPSELISDDPLLDWGHNSDCCQWNGVICDNSTKNVIKLDLSPPGYFYVSGEQSKSRYIHLTMFLPFKKLQALSMRGRRIAGFFKDEGLERLSQLEYLDLSLNYFNNNIMSSLSALSTLKNLSLSENDLQGTLYLEDFKNFASLNYLDLSSNRIEAIESIKGFESLSKSSYLEYLDLSLNKFNNNILASLSALSTLKTLSLSWNNLQGTLYFEDFKNFASLKYLDLSGNRIEAIESIKGFESLSKSSDLEHLDLSDNDFNNSILPFLGSLPSLKILKLVSNRLLQGTIHIPDTLLNLEELDISTTSIKEFVTLKGDKSLSKLEILYTEEMIYADNIKLLQSMGPLPFLKTLHIGYNIFDETTTIMNFSNFKKLELLDMTASTGLNSKLLQSIRDMNALKFLILSFSGLNGTLSALQGLCDSRHLEVLDLGQNDFTGTLPACFANLTSLKTLDLSYNQFTGDIAESPITSMKSLQALVLSHNHFKIPISFGSLYNHSKLKVFEGDSLLIYDGPDPQSLFPEFQLNTIWLSGHGDIRAFPKFLCHQHDLEVVYINDAHFKGEFPNCLLDNNTRLNELDLKNNSLSRLSDFSNRSYSHLRILDISNNLFNGGIPLDFGVSFPNLRRLNMSSNQFDGHIPSSFGDMSLLEILDISNKNRLEGPIPLEFCKLKNLQALDLSENDISGMIQSCFNPPGIQIIRLSKNKLQGTLEHALSGSSSMLLLDLSNNQLTGSIPNWIHRLSHLNVLLLNNNYLGGEIPMQLCQLDQLSLINLSHNDLYGTIPDCLRITPIEDQREIPNADAPAPTTAPGPSTGTFSPATAPTTATFASIPNVNIDHVEFPTKTTSYNYQGEILYMMSGIDLSCNKFFGEISPQLGNLSSIHVLNLSHNYLSGPIPPTFGNLKQVESLDLSNNLLTGNIPPELGVLSSLSFFSVTNNNLSGKIPTTTQFTTFNESNFQGNRLLCGAPLPKSCNDRGPESPRALVDHGEDGGFMDMECFYASFGASYLTVLLGLVAVLLINPYWRRWWFYHIERWITSSYYFVVDNFPKRFFPWKV